jgi:hypothetical protein
MSFAVVDSSEDFLFLPGIDFRFGVSIIASIRSFLPKFRFKEMFRSM